MRDRWTLILLLFIIIPFLYLTQTVHLKKSKPVEKIDLSAQYSRCIYFKLPLSQTRFHWNFNSRDDFFSGSLKLKWANRDRAQKVTVFENGILSNDWEVLGKKKKNSKSVYFGFVSRKKYKVSRSDSVTLNLIVLRNLDGIGPNHQGILKAGSYTALNVFTFYDSIDTTTVFLKKENWQPSWDLKITENTGWMKKRKKEKKEKNSKNDLSQEFDR